MDRCGVVILRATPIQPDPRVEKIGRALVGAGYAVRALGWDRAGDLPALENAAGFPVLRLSVRAPWARGLRNLPALLRWQIALLGWLGRERSSYQIIHACDFDTVLPALWAQRRWGKRVVYDIFDFYADMLRATPNPLRRILRGLEQMAIRQADALLLADPSRYAQIAGARPRRSAVIYNAPEDSAADSSAPLPGTHPASSLRLAYVGLLQVERGLLPLLDVLADHPEWHLDLAGTGAESDLITRQAARLPNVTWHGRVPYAQALALNAAADVLPALYDPAIANHRYASPNKLFEGMLLGKPVIAARGTNFDRLVLEENCGLVVDYGDRAQLTAALRQLEDPDLRLQQGKNARQAYETRYGWQRMRERLLDIYRQVEPTPCQKSR